MTDPADHRRRRESLGAYVLGALEPEERRAVEAHLADCSSCRDELAWLSAMPPLLGRLRPEEVADDRLVPPAMPDVSAFPPLHVDDRLARRTVRRWQAATALATAAALAMLVAWGPWEASGPTFDRWVLQPVAAAADLEGTATAIAWEWGTTVELDLSALPPAERYVLIAIDRDGRRQQAGTWGPTASGEARVRGACSIQRPDLEQIAVEDADGTVLAQFEVAPPA